MKCVFAYGRTQSAAVAATPPPQGHWPNAKKMSMATDSPIQMIQHQSRTIEQNDLEHGSEIENRLKTFINGDKKIKSQKPQL